MAGVLLEDFSELVPEGQDGGLQEAELRLSSFEAGYQAGWDDAAASLAESADKAIEGLGQSLSDMAFGFHEARAHMVSALRPVLEEMFSAVLPMLAREGLPSQIVALAERLVSAGAETPLELATHPDDLAVVMAALEGRTAPPLKVIPDETQPRGAYLVRSGTGAGHQIDVGRVLEEISQLVAAAFDEEEGGAAHGQSEQGV